MKVSPAQPPLTAQAWPDRERRQPVRPASGDRSLPSCCPATAGPASRWLCIVMCAFRAPDATAATTMAGPGLDNHVGELMRVVPHRIVLVDYVGRKFLDITPIVPLGSHHLAAPVGGLGRV